MRAITREEHERILAAEQDTERFLYYWLLWEIGASQSDAAKLRAENFDLRSGGLIELCQFYQIYPEIYNLEIGDRFLPRIKKSLMHHRQQLLGPACPHEIGEMIIRSGYGGERFDPHYDNSECIKPFSAID